MIEFFKHTNQIEPAMEKAISRSVRLVLLLLLLPFISEAQIVKPVNTPINNPTATDGYPSLSADGKELVIMSDRDRTGKMKIYHSRRISDERWHPPRQVLPGLYDKGFVGGAFLSLDASTLFFHSSMEESTVGVEDIYFSKKEGDHWGTPQNIGKPVNSTSFEGHPSLSPEGDRLFFVRLKENKSNCPVIMMAVRGRDGKWLNPIELPAAINKSCETTPRILADGKTLLFASDRAGGKGGFDLYYSRRQEDGQWAEPVNLAYLNTENSDFAGTYSPDDHSLVYQSQGNIMQSTLPVQQAILQENFCMVKGYTKDGVSYKPLSSRIVIRSLSASEKPLFISNDSVDGSYSVLLQPGSNYTIEVNARGFLPEKKEIALATATPNQLLQVNFELLPETIELHYYFTDSLTKRPVQPELTLFSIKEKSTVPLTYDARNNIFKARIKLREKYQIEASMEGYSLYTKLLLLEDMSSYKPVRFEEELRRRFYPFTFIAVEASSGKAIPDAEFTITDLDSQNRLFPFYDAGTQEYRVELEEQGRYQLQMKAEGYKPQEEVISSFQLIQSKKFRKEIGLEIF